MWVRGLKPLERVNASVLEVAPYVGAWIETEFDALGYEVTPRRTLCGCVD